MRKENKKIIECDLTSRTGRYFEVYIDMPTKFVCKDEKVAVQSFKNNISSGRYDDYIKVKKLG